MASGLDVVVDTSQMRVIKFSIAVEKYKDTIDITRTIMVIPSVISTWQVAYNIGYAFHYPDCKPFCLDGAGNQI